MIYEFQLPWPPSLNRYYRTFGGKVLISAEGRKYRESVRIVMRDSGIALILSTIAMTLECYPPDKRRRDLDNLLKALFDALQHGGAYVDDSQIKELHAWMREPIETAFVLVTIREMQ